MGKINVAIIGVGSRASSLVQGAECSGNAEAEVWDSPTSAGVVSDAIRCAKLGLDRGRRGPLLAPSSYFMKSPPVEYHDDKARDMVEALIAEG